MPAIKSQAHQSSSGAPPSSRPKRYRKPQTSQARPKRSASSGTLRRQNGRLAKQLTMIKPGKAAYGGVLRNTRKGRSHPRPISVRQSMHLVLRSSKAKGQYSFLRPQNAKTVKSIIDKFSFIYGVQILSQANVGNHLHLHLRLGSRFGYKPFIRAITGAIAMAISGRSRWTAKKIQGPSSTSTGESREILAGKFWDYRPFTRVVEGLRSFLRMEDYVRINRLEALGINRGTARSIVDVGKSR